MLMAATLSVEAHLYGGKGIKINMYTVSLDDSSFAWRDSLITFQMYTASPDFRPPFLPKAFSSSTSEVSANARAIARR